MPKNWLYFIALFLPLILRVLILNTSFVDWLSNEQYMAAYVVLDGLRDCKVFLDFIGGWVFPVFVVTIFCLWTTDDNTGGIADQFLLLPIFYVPFSILGDLVVTREFHPSNLYVHPLIIIPAGYLYIFAWAVLVWVLDRMRLVL